MSNRQHFGRFPLLFLLLLVDISLGEQNNICNQEADTLRVKYGRKQVSPGALLPLTLFQDPMTRLLPPNVEYVKASKGSNYILLMIDRDAPQGPWLHWMVMNITVDDLKGDGNFTGGTKMGYQPPSPPSGTHRYFFSLYHQPANETMALTSKVVDRVNFDVGALVKDFHLDCVAETHFQTTAISTNV